DMAYFGGGPANPHWNSYSTQPAGPICTNDMCGDNAFEGNNYLWIGLMDGEFGGGEVAGVTQTVTIPAGGYEFSMMLWNSENFSDQLTVTLDSTVIYSTTGGANFDDYYPIVVDITSFADENDHVLGIEASVFSRSYGFVLDSVAIEPVPCLALSDISWASALQTSGTMLRDTSLEVSVFFDATGLTPGVYNANLCVDTNAPSNPTVPVPLSLQVLYDVFLPIMTR
ncbi:MAG: hypothetical protein GY803_06365, partial [Chloroflexi bacterium]|nr:hypothetical protein [Chloroflexota bacterium]